MVGQMLDLAAEAGESLEYLSLADTMAWATPLSIQRVVGAVRERFPALRLSLHLPQAVLTTPSPRSHRS